MSIENLGAFPHTVGNLDDKPNLPAARMKAAFEQDCLELWTKVAEMIPELNAKIPASEIVKAIDALSTDSSIPTSKAVYSLVADALLGTGGSIATSVINAWLAAHPEATTTVTDNAVTTAKIKDKNVTDAKLDPNGVIGAVAFLREFLDMQLGLVNFELESGGMYQATGIEYVSDSRARSKFIPVTPNERIYLANYSDSSAIAVFEFATNTPTTAETNTVIAFTSMTSANAVVKVSASTHYIRLMLVDTLENVQGKFLCIRERSQAGRFVTPSMFRSDTVDTDAKMIQAAVNFAFANHCDVAFDRMYTLASGEYILLDKYPSAYSDRYQTRFFALTGGPLDSGAAGVGITKEYSGNIFMTTDAYCFSGDFIFDGLKFYSTPGAETNVFDATRLMRFTVKDCFFKNVDSICKNVPEATLPSDRDDYWQSVTFKDCTVIGGNGWAFYGSGCYDTVFDHVMIEHRDGGIRFGSLINSQSYNYYYFKARMLTIRNCCIEGLSGQNIKSITAGVPDYGAAIYIDNPMRVEIDGCYFEQNYKNIVLFNSNESNMYAATIHDCWLSGFFYNKRYGDQTTYLNAVDDTYLVTITGTKGMYHIVDCGSERGGIVNAPSSEDGITIYYFANAKEASAKGKMDYGNYSFDSDLDAWVGSNPAGDAATVTSGNNNPSACLTYKTEALS